MKRYTNQFWHPQRKPDLPAYQEFKTAGSKANHSLQFSFSLSVNSQGSDKSTPLSYDRAGGHHEVEFSLYFSSVAPCKGIHDSLGFWIPPCGFRIPSTGFRIPGQWIPDSKKGWIPIFFCFNAFLRISFSCSNLVILKDVV